MYFWFHLCWVYWVFSRKVGKRKCQREPCTKRNNNKKRRRRRRKRRRKRLWETIRVCVTAFAMQKITQHTHTQYTVFSLHPAISLVEVTNFLALGSQMVLNCSGRAISVWAGGEKKKIGEPRESNKMVHTHKKKLMAICHLSLNLRNRHRRRRAPWCSSRTTWPLQSQCPKCPCSGRPAIKKKIKIKTKKGGWEMAKLGWKNTETNINKHK